MEISHPRTSQLKTNFFDGEEFSKAWTKIKSALYNSETKKQ